MSLSEKPTLRIPGPCQNENEQYLDIWHAFQKLQVPFNHRKDIQEWARDKGSPLVLVALTDPSDDLTLAYQKANDILSGLGGVELLPDDFHHVSTNSFGFLTDAIYPEFGQFPRAGLTELTDHLNSELEPQNPFAIQFGGLNAFYSTIFSEVRSNYALQALRCRVQQSTQNKYPFVSTDFSHNFIFHQTRAFLTTDAKIGSLVKAITPFREAKFGVTQVTTLSLIEFPLDGMQNSTSFNTIASFPLTVEKNTKNC